MFIHIILQIFDCFIFEIFLILIFTKFMVLIFRIGQILQLKYFSSNMHFKSSLLNPTWLQCYNFTFFNLALLYFYLKLSFYYLNHWKMFYVKQPFSLYFHTFNVIKLPFSILQNYGRNGSKTVLKAFIALAPGTTDSFTIDLDMNNSFPSMTNHVHRIAASDLFIF